MVYGSLRQWPLLDGYISALLDKPLRRKDHDIQALLLLGAYQILFMRTPAHAAVSETVATAQSLKKTWAKGLVNGVLRRLIREQAALAQTLSGAQRAAAPAWLYAQLHEDWPNDVAQILEASRSHPPLILRANSAKTSREALIDQWQRDGIECAIGSAPQSIILSKPVDVFTLPGFNDGLCSVQDTSAQWAALWLNPQPGERILDACAAPGGKVCHIAELQPDLALLNAWDISEERLGRVTENQNRLGLSFETACADISQGAQERYFDAVLVDAPCSASGVLRRNPDVKVLRRAEDIAGFAKQQKAILEGAWQHVAPGGRLLYCTCSVLRQENDDVVTAFVAQGKDRSLGIINSNESIATATGRQFLPDPVGGDGLFYALLCKAA